MKRSFVLAATLVVSVVLHFAIAAPDPVRLETGLVRGISTEGVIAFKGIPYAKAPIGDLRWRPPQPATAWDDIRSAASYAPDCAQLPFPGDVAPLGTESAEDCLYVNVWVPADRLEGKLAVMVWIYGGGYVNGGSSPAVYDGSQFARRGVVFVSFNYRLGRFGFFAHPALSCENPAEPHATEIPFVFDTVEARYGSKLTPEDRAIAQAANAYWVNFAKTGDPNGIGLPEWPRYSAQTDVLLDFSPTGPAALPDPRKDRLDLIESLVSRSR